jgi:hypothetical protein
VITLPQFGSEIPPNSLIVHGFGQDANGELCMLPTNTPANAQIKATLAGLTTGQQ